MTDWLYPHWVVAALCMAIFLILLVPCLATSWDMVVLLLYLQAPLYMLHQVEEHTGDRFRAYVNHAFGGYEALTPAAVLVINIIGVWVLMLLSLYAALFFGLGWGLAGIYLVLVNAVVHIIAGVVGRGYNPGLWTALALFLPFDGYALWIISSRPGVETIHHAVGLGLAVAIHIAIIVHARVRVSRLAAAKRR